MTKQAGLTTTEKKSMEGYLDTIRKAMEIGEYEMALTAMESLKQIIVEKLMVIHHGDADKQ